MPSGGSRRTRDESSRGSWLGTVPSGSRCDGSYGARQRGVRSSSAAACDERLGRPACAFCGSGDAARSSRSRRLPEGAHQADRCRTPDRQSVAWGACRGTRPRAWRRRWRSPFFRRAEAGVDKGFRQIEFATVAKVLREPLEDALEDARALPHLKAAVTRLVRGIAGRQVVPGRTGAKHPQHSVQHGAGVGPRTAASIGAARWSEQRLEDRPLRVSEIHAVEYDGDRNFVHTPRLGFMR
jgi:hypothetical protein